MTDFWNKKRVLVTGHTGFKGSWLSLWLTWLGAEVVGYSLPPDDNSLFNIAGVEKKIFHSEFGDVNHLNRLSDVIKDMQPEIVFHLAAQSLVRESYRNPVETYQTNVIGTVNLLESTRKSDCVKAIVVITTDKCYENKEWYWGYRENDVLGGQDPYASSKACAELVVDAYRKSFFSASGIYLATARAGNVIGGGDWSNERLVPDCIRAFENKDILQIRSPQAIRPWQFVLEPLNGYLILAEKLYIDGAKLAEGWNFGPDEDDACEVGKIVDALGEKLGFAYNFSESAEFHEAKYLKLDCSKAKIKLNWQSKLSLDETLDWVVDWYRAYYTKQDMAKVTLGQIVKYANR